MQEDTYRGDRLNLYTYCANNPVVYYDPSGHVKVTYGDGGLPVQDEYQRVKPLIREVIIPV